MDAPLQPRLSRRRFLASLGLAAAGGAAAVVAVAEIGSQVGRAQPAPSGSSFGPLDAATPPASPQPSADYSAFRNHYRSRPDLTPPAVLVQVPAGAVAPGLLFCTPSNGSGHDGPAIFTNDGELVWLRPDSGTQVTNFNVIQFAGQPALAWWEGIVNGGIGTGDVVVTDRSYREIARVRAGNGRRADLHEFQVTPSGTALLLADAGVPATSAPGGAGLNGQVLDCAVQEIDLQTGAVLFEWHTADHVSIDESFIPYSADATAIYDYVHANSIDVDTDGGLLVSARNTSTVYKIDRASGAIVWRLGGKRSDFAMGAGANFSWQHDARRQADGTLTIFDDSTSPGHSRAIVLRLDEQAETATLVRAFERPTPLFARSQGNLQLLPRGNVLVGWGDAGYVSEFSGSGELVFDATYPAAVQSYRNFRSPWTGRPVELPAAAAVTGPGGAVTAFASWNGATDVASWDVLAGSRADVLVRAGSAPRTGFETSIPVEGAAAFVRVVGRDSRGAVLGTSPVVAVSG